MIFSPALARAVAAGRKTQTRRPVKADKSCRYKVGHDYAVQPGRGKPSNDGVTNYGRIKVVDIREEPVGAITFLDARAEGFRSTSEFKAYWVRMYESAWIKRELIDRVAVYDDTCSIVDWILNERFEQRHADTLVTVIQFERVPEVPRFLAQPGPNQGDYTPQRHRAIDDLECVDEVTQRRFTEKVRKENEARRASFRRDLEAERARRRNARVLMFRRAA